jgi:hypothetical protein
MNLKKSKIIARILTIVLLSVLLSAIISGPAAALDASGVVTTWTGNNGDLFLYHKHTEGTGIPIIIMPVHFGPGDLAAGGNLQTASKWAAELILASEAFSDLMDYFDIYIYIESCPNGIFPVPQSGYVDSFFDKYAKARELTAQKTRQKSRDDAYDLFRQFRYGGSGRRPRVRRRGRDALMGKKTGWRQLGA